jgi:hypothetical protein
MKHITQKLARKYIALQLDEQGIIEIDRHLSSCDACAERVRALRLIADDFDAVWDSWTAKSHTQTPLQDRISRALARLAASEISSEIRVRIKAWRDEIQIQSETALKVILDGSKRTARIISEGMQDVLSPGFGPRPAGIPIRTRGPVRTRGTLRMTRSTIDEPIEIKAIVSAWNFILNENLNVELIEKESIARIKIDDINKPCELAVLDPDSPDGSPICGLFELKNDCLLTEIKDVRAGKYSLYLL